MQIITTDVIFTMNKASKTTSEVDEVTHYLIVYDNGFHMDFGIDSAERDDAYDAISIGLSKGNSGIDLTGFTYILKRNNKE